MPIKSKRQRKAKSYCNIVPQLAHELNQSLLIIHAYVKGCTERIKGGSLDLEQLNMAFSSINKQIQIMGDKINAPI